MPCVYKLTFQNGLSYIGITTKSAKRRYTSHRLNAANGHDAVVYRAWRKYGAPELTIIELVDDRQSLYEAEVRLIIEHNTLQPFGYNQLPGGDIPPMVILGHHSEKTRLRISESLKGRPSPNKGKTASNETREKMRLSHIGKHHRRLTDEEKLHLSEVNQGKTLSEDTKHKISIKSAGRLHTQEAKNRISASKIGKPRKDNGYRHPPEVIARIFETRRHNGVIYTEKGRAAIAESNRHRASNKIGQAAMASLQEENTTGDI